MYYKITIVSGGDLADWYLEEAHTQSISILEEDYEKVEEIARYLIPKGFSIGIESFLYEGDE